MKKRKDSNIGTIKIYVGNPDKGVVIKDEDCIRKLQKLQKAILSLQRENTALKRELVKLKKELAKRRKSRIIVPKRILIKAGKDNTIHSVVNRDIIGSLMEIILSTS